MYQLNEWGEREYRAAYILRQSTISAIAVDSSKDVCAKSPRGKGDK